jgi:hypothetical protein
MDADLLKHLIEICGSDYVLHSPEAIELYSMHDSWSRTCGAVVLRKRRQVFELFDSAMSSECSFDFQPAQLGLWNSLAAEGV